MWVLAGSIAEREQRLSFFNSSASRSPDADSVGIDLVGQDAAAGGLVKVAGGWAAPVLCLRWAVRLSINMGRVDSRPLRLRLRLVSSCSLARGAEAQPEVTSSLSSAARSPWGMQCCCKQSGGWLRRGMAWAGSIARQAVGF